jgi:phage repressor protein C with HTH and peptisase S24 domain
MNLLSERLLWAMQEEQKRRDGKRVTKAELARVAGVSDTAAGNWLKGDHGMDAPKARAIGAYLQVDPLWLETGQGSPVPDSREAVVIRSQPVRAHHPDDPLPDDVVLVPESRIEFAAGNGRHAVFELVDDDEPATYRLSWFRREGMHPDRVRRFRVSGDSQEPFLYDRDIVLVNLDETNVIDGKLYAIRYGDDLRVKFLFRKLDGTLVLRSVNSSYPDEEVPPDLANEHISIVGRVRDKSGKGGL